MIKDKRIIVVSGPSGVGKTTLCARLAEEEPRIKLCVTATTRSPRSGERNGIDYWFISKEDFKDWLERGEIVEYVELFGNFYGTPKKSLDDIFNEGRYPLLRIDVKGAQSVKRLGYKGIFIFILPPDEETLIKRLKKRQTESVDMEKRVAQAKEELKYKNDYEFQVINDDLEKALVEMKEILSCHLFNNSITRKR